MSGSKVSIIFLVFSPYGLYLDCLFIIPEMKDKGFGQTMFPFLAKVTINKKCGRF